jgi:glutamine---fructose-6-phosphate transaminase (isomerizing)
MCGIAGFLANRRWRQTGETAWLTAAVNALRAAADAAALDEALALFAGRFDSLMAFATHLAAIRDPALRETLVEAARLTGEKEALLKASPLARHEAVERTAERLRDYAWQLGREVLDNIDRTQSLLPPGLDANDSQHFVAWAAGQVLENIDRLEVRGRDSAGISVQLTIPPQEPLRLRTLRDRAKAMGADGRDTNGSLSIRELPDGLVTVRGIFKTAQLIGSLGDNGAVLRRGLRGHGLFWELAGEAEGVSIIAHTRWASHGAINLPNCHPLSGRLAGDAPGTLAADADAVCALNGDVDNFLTLKAAHVDAAGLTIPAEITGDTKIIPVLFRTRGGNATIEDRFLSTLRQLDGSMAIVLQHPEDPERLYLGQKGSGQSIFIAEVADGLIFASENYGLAPRARSSTAMAQLEQGGLQVTLSVLPDEPALKGRTIDEGTPAALRREVIEVFARDIFRGDYAYFFEKEVHESAASVRKTLVGRYQRTGRTVSFSSQEAGPWQALRRRFSDPAAKAVRRIWVTGQGTAAIAGMGIAHLLRQALAGTGIHIESAKASELSSNLDGAVLDDALVIAISQSGTTTDTNRTVDLARAAGAWIHAIVNRRNSPLVRKSDSHLFTSDGRDIEMAVASTKAFYSQIAAGKLTALCLADVLGSLPVSAIHDDLVALEGLPARIQEVLDGEIAIAALAERLAPFNRYWAVVGNGPNKIAAEEIRIKLSELCYKSIPVDHTEDKKHIDLSTEPLTLVIANDLPPLLAQDTAKEVAIFKAHNGKPVVFAARGESCFDSSAEAVIRLPSVGAGLDFVLATVAGHLFGFHAARAIDRRSADFRALFSLAGELRAEALAGRDSGREPGREPETGLPRLNELARGLDTALQKVADGELDAALPPRSVARLAALRGRLRRDSDAALLGELEQVLRDCFEETSRPIDTIRHQAKTVTVGISRPGRELGQALHLALTGLGVDLNTLAEHDRQTLIALSPLVTAVPGGLYYQVTGDGPDGLPLLQVSMRSGRANGVPSGYDRPRIPAGSKRRALRLGRAVLSSGPHGVENLLLIPVFRDGDRTVKGLVLLHASLAAQSSTQQKTAMLKELKLYDDLLDAFAEASHATGRSDFGTFIEATAPRDLLFVPVLELVRR